MRFVFLQLIISPSFSHCFTTFCGNFCSFLCLCYIWMKSVTDDTGVWTWIARQWKRRPPFTIKRYNMPWTGCGLQLRVWEFACPALADLWIGVGCICLIYIFAFEALHTFSFNLVSLCFFLYFLFCFLCIGFSMFSSPSRSFYGSSFDFCPSHFGF